MPSERLTKSLVDGLQPRQDRVADFFIWDAGKGAVSGFGVKVTPAGGKTFVFQYRLRGKRQDRRYSIGRFGDWTVETARDRARELRRLVDSDIDPIDQAKHSVVAAARAREEARERSFKAVSNDWLKAYSAGTLKGGARVGRNRSASTIEMVTRAVAYLQAQFVGLRIDEIDKRALQKAINSIPSSKAATRRNTFASARILWTWARGENLLTDNPFDCIVDVPPVVPRRERVLADDELVQVWQASEAIGYPFGGICQLLALTGQRRDEVAEMGWHELDRATAAWTIPGSRTKNGLAHIVPLSPLAITVLDGIAPKAPDWPTKGYVFTTKPKRPVSGFSGAKGRLETKLADLAKEAEIDPPGPWRIHDLRRTVATGLQRLGVRLEVTEAVLNHTSGSMGGIRGVYQRHDFAPEKREALGRWASCLAALINPPEKENVVSIDAAKKSA